VPAAARNAYAELLRDTRGLRREQQLAREAWLSRLSADKKEDSLFELEILLKGLACFANPRNHPGHGRGRSNVSHDFREHLGHARDAMQRIVQLSRTLLGSRDRAFVFHRYLETMLPEDTARTRLLAASMGQDSPEASLSVLRHGLTNLLEVGAGLLRLSRVPFRLFYAHVSSAMREIAQSSFFNPLRALEFRPEFDRIGSVQVLELIQRVPGEEAHRLVALTFLSLFRMLRYIRLLDGIAVDASDRRSGRAWLVLAVLRSDARALSTYLSQRAGSLLAESFERDLLRVPASEIATRHDEIVGEAHRLVAVKGALTGISANLRLEMRRTFDHDLPAIDAGTPDAELRARIRQVTANLRPALQNAVLFFAKSLGAKLEERRVFDDQAVRRATSERLRRDVWCFAQILRAFAIKAQHVGAPEEGWTGAASFAFVREFLAYFRAMGYPLLRVGDYPRFDGFMDAMNSLEETDLLDPPRVEAAVREAEAFHAFLDELFDRISKRDELSGVPFDKPGAARALKLYLGG
jgi:hypothetical protein